MGLLHSMPLLLLFDFAAAFPSVAHAWIFNVLLLINMPEGLYDLICALYKCNMAYMCTPAGNKFIFMILWGVLQGCPLSGSLFVMAIDPLLHMFRIMLEDSALGAVRACADDIGIALRTSGASSFLYDVFAKI